MSALGKKAVDLAAQSIGVREEASNWGRWISVYLKFVSIFSPAPWCAAFVAFKINQAAQVLSVPNPYLSGIRAASCSAVYAWAKTQGRVLPAPEEGCVFLVRGKSPGVFVHTGFVSDLRHGARVGTVEGNTNIDGSSEGVGVFARERSAANLVFIRV